MTATAMSKRPMRRRHGCNVPTADGSLSGFFSPSLTAEERGIAKIEGWILGVV